MRKGADSVLTLKSSWDTMKRRIIEEKLERLGVERGSGSTVPHIHAPHARAASVCHIAHGGHVFADSRDLITNTGLLPFFFFTLLIRKLLFI